MERANVDTVIRAWECCTDEIGQDNCSECPYNNDFNGCMLILKKDTIELLKFYKEHEHDVCANCHNGESLDESDVIKRLVKVSHYFKSMLKAGCDVDADVYREYRESIKMAISVLREQKRKKGSWDYGTQCSVCKGTIVPPWKRDIRVNFCPWCGADMRGEYDA